MSGAGGRDRGAARRTHALGVLAVVVVLSTAACSGSGSGNDAAPGSDDPEPVSGCDWPMWGQNIARTFSYPCESELSPDTVDGLARQWFFNTRDVTTATPAVVGERVYVGDWSGRFYALDLDTGDELWSYDAPVHPTVYSGQIVSSAAVHDLDDGSQVVFFAGGRTVHALDTADGSERWAVDMNPDGGDDDPTEIQSSPLVAPDIDGRDLVVVGFDSHDTPGVRAGIRALDADTGDMVWDFDPDLGNEPSGCTGVWGSPSLDPERGLLFVGSANCRTSPDGWGEYTEAVYALDVASGEAQWSFQPHEPNNDDLDFAGAPNLYSVDDTDVVGLGNKDAAYYALERDGTPLWSTAVTEPGIESPGSNYSTGGFIGGTAVADGLVLGGTAVGPCPCAHALDAATGEIVWQSDTPASTYASAAEVGGVMFLGGTDFTLRAFDAASGEILWSEEMSGVVAGGVAVADDRVVAVAGIREPGLDATSETSGVTMFSLDEPTTTTTSAPAASDSSVGIVLENGPQECVGTPCVVTFGINDPPPGTSPVFELLVESDPFRVSVTATDVGDPAGWLRPGSAAAEVGATVFGVVISESDDDPQSGGVLCTFNAGESGCSTETVPVLQDQYTRISILAMDDPTTVPTVADGVDRLVRSQSFDPPLIPVPIPE